MGARLRQGVSFLTWNIYLGADLSPLIGGLTPPAVAQVYRQFLATNFPVRAKAIASQIASRKPDLIGLQEAERWELEVSGFWAVVYDFVELLLDELKAIGLHYEAAARNHNRDLKDVPDSNGNKISFLDRDVILIRKEQGLQVIDKKEVNFTTNFAGFIRGWSSVDVKFDKLVFRLINTHLEPLDFNTRNAQALELINGPANTDLPVILTGDLNLTPANPTFTTLVSSGLRDVWTEVGAGFGFTGVQAPDLLNAASALNIRIDYILFKNVTIPINADLVGEEQRDRTPAALWPSDHAGVFATFKL